MFSLLPPLPLYVYTHTHTHTDVPTLVLAAELDEYLQKGVNILTSYINELRTFMIKFPWKLIDTVDEYDVNENIPTVKENDTWEKLSFKVNMSNYHISFILQIHRV
jgi:hypothetical protein